MRQDKLDTSVNLQQMMQLVAQKNPHVSLTYIAFLLDIPYESDSADHGALLAEEV